MLSLGGERRTTNVFDHYLNHDLVMLPAIMVFFAHLLTLSYLDHQNLINSSLYYPGPLHKISSQSIHNVLSNVVHANKQTDRPDKLTNANISSFAKEVKKKVLNYVCTFKYIVLKCCIILVKCKWK